MNDTRLDMEAGGLEFKASLSYIETQVQTGLHEIFSQKTKPVKSSY